ncbi:MAG: hypothetical protein K2P57_05215 [Burkholderiales bacterium]|nr:hypothetical protein [Burkholderiales bacterium]
MSMVFSLASFAQEGPASSVVNVFEEAAFQKAAVRLSPDGRNLLAAELDMPLRQYREAVPLLKSLAEKHAALPETSISRP